MNRNRLIITSSSDDEVITKYILSNRYEFEVDIEIVRLKDLLKNYTIDDEVNDEEAIIRWTKPNGTVISNNNSFLLNRVTNISESLFKDFVQEDRRYARSEFAAYIGFAFNSFQGIGNNSYDGICATIYSLPEQWEKVRDIHELETPIFYWGPREFNYFRAEDTIIYSEVRNLLNWRDSYSVKSFDNIFCFKKPSGSAVFALNIGTKTFIENYESLNGNMKANIIRLLKILRKKFDYFIFEVLFFVDDRKITFGCINHEIVKMKNNKLCDMFIAENLMQEFKKCL